MASLPYFRPDSCKPYCSRDEWTRARSEDDPTLALALANLLGPDEDFEALLSSYKAGEYPLPDELRARQATWAQRLA